MKRYKWSTVQLGHMAQAVKPGDVERINKETELLKSLPKLQRPMALRLLRGVKL
jgi:hypothetical protein